MTHTLVIIYENVSANTAAWWRRQPHTELKGHPADTLLNAYTEQLNSFPKI